MPHFVVLLRGVNVGTGNRVPMADFKRLLETQGYAQVQTLLNSGNAVFHGARRSSPAHAKAIATCLNQELGVDVPVVVKSAAEFLAVVNGVTKVPGDAEHSRFLVVFAQDPQSLQDLSVLSSIVKPPETFAIGGQAAYLHCPKGISESKTAAALLGRIGRNVTTRNWGTVLKLKALLSTPAGTISP
jgi:uncharacterized protein (DUF1697 family)